MGVPFPELNPYEVLQIAPSASPIEVKKAYKKMSLRFHPDKIQQSSVSSDDVECFPKIQFAYSILSNPSKRQIYDATGSLDHQVGEGAEDELFNWKEYFDTMCQNISIEMINEDRSKYQKSEEEKNDILHNFIYYEGDFLRLFEVIPHLEFDEAEENRVFKIVEDEINDGSLQGKLDEATLKSWNKYKKTRKTKVKLMLKRLAKEAKEAEELEKEINGRKGKEIKSEAGLKSIIRQKNSNKLDDLINNLEAKYVNKKGKKRGSYEISDSDFEQAQKQFNGHSRSKARRN